MAEIFEAHLLAVAVSYDPIIPGTVMGGIPPEIIEGQRRESDKKARTAMARFEQAAKRAGIPSETRVINESLQGAADTIGRIGRRFDLIIVGQPDRRARKIVGRPGCRRRRIFESGRPVIFVPFIQKGRQKLDRIMICWDGGRAAARAVADALPFLKKAKQVEVAIISDKPSKSDEVPGADLGQHLARHGFKVDVKHITSPDIDVPSTILSHASDSSADMIVMGGIWPFALARVRARRGHTRLARSDDGAGIDVALTATKPLIPASRSQWRV